MSGKCGFQGNSEEKRLGRILVRWSGRPVLALFLWACLLAWPCPAGAASSTVSAKPEWIGSTSIESPDGKASLAWNYGKGTLPEFLRLTEKVQGETRISYINGVELYLNRFSPGVYRFSLEGCFRDQDGLPACSSRSKELSLSVSDAIYEPYLQQKPSEIPTFPESNTANRGPAQLRPGRWFNPDKSVMGWSMYWSNRLALSQNPSDV
ncbi:MAG TPA: hypothetical protein VFG52_00655, partial [Xanthomonadales bacterium]|nr:hypothetical protein [Xanthomonadales bacterium]